MDTTHQKIQVPPQKLRMTSEVLERIRDTIGMRPAETGGILGGNRETCEVTHFYFDEDAEDQGRSFYTPNIKKLNRIIKYRWKPQHVELLGVVHSHPPHTIEPSEGDTAYALRILEELDLPYLLTPIVTTIPDVDTNSFCLYPYAGVRAGGSVGFIKQELIVDNRAVDFEKQKQAETELYEFELVVAAIDNLLTATDNVSASIKNLTIASLAVLELAQCLHWHEVKRQLEQR